MKDIAGAVALLFAFMIGIIIQCLPLAIAIAVGLWIFKHIFN